jgi:O-methyltransferase involved in polyketide biosynthesis
MYLSKDATAATLRNVATLAAGSSLAMTFLLPLDLVAPEDRPLMEAAQRGAASSGTPFVSFFAPDEMLALAREAGFREAQHVATANYVERYFAERSDGLRPATGEEMLVAAT